MSATSEPTTASFAPETVSAQCPQCGTSFTAQVTPIVNAADKQAQSRLLSGRLNIATCPACGTASRVGGPVLYFDLEKELALVLAPGSLAISHDQQEKAIGRLTNRVVDSLPPEQRRMYLLQPKMFFTDASFMEAVLESVGIKPEDLRQAEESALLIEELLGLMTVEATRGRLEAVGRADDTRLVSLATALAEEAARAGDARRAQALLALRERLIEVTGPPTITMEELLQELLAAREAGELTSMVAALRPVLGYEFYAALAELIEAADDPGEKSDLEALRAAMLESSDELDAQAEAELARVARRLEAVLLAPDPAKLLEEQADSIDEAFLLVTEANLRMALEQGRAEEAAKLQQVLDATFAVLERRLPPQIRLVNQLARCEDDECREQLIAASPELIDDDLLEMLRATAARAREGDAIPVADSLEAAAKLAVDRLAATGGADDADGSTDGAAPSPQGDE